ncbi:hypothetical protein GOODEAATRI_020161 [Goodea atripinnis]|uniref:Uncharacterized protein n=1 Tax=Goodea atripinnis TaxID=208336 RepID=A0ABV0PQ62_9TELE
MIVILQTEMSCTVLPLLVTLSPALFFLLLRDVSVTQGLWEDYKYGRHSSELLHQEHNCSWTCMLLAQTCRFCSAALFVFWVAPRRSLVKVRLSRNLTIGCDHHGDTNVDLAVGLGPGQGPSTGHPCPPDAPFYYFPINHQEPWRPCG